MCRFFRFRCANRGGPQSQAGFIALGINEKGRRQVFGVELSNRESRSSWTAFVKGLKTRGLPGGEFVVSDGY